MPHRARLSGPPSSRRARFLFSALALLLIAWSAPAAADVTVNATFSPPTIGPGSASALTLTLENTSAPKTSGALTVALPAGMTLASDVSTSCTNAVLSGARGAASLTMSDARLGTGARCTIEALVVAPTPGAYTLQTGAVSTDQGSFPGAASDLTVDPSRLGVRLAFAPASVRMGERSRLTLTLDHSASATQVFNINAAQTLAAGLRVADVPNLVTDCTTINHTLSGGAHSLFISLLQAGASCSASFDVVAEVAGSITQRTGAVNTSSGSVGLGVATIEVTSEPLMLRAQLMDNPRAAGDAATLRLTIDNLDRAQDLSNLAFTLDLGAALSGLVATGTPLQDACGAGSSLSGTSTLTLTGGALAAGTSCTFDLTLQLPAGAASGEYALTTSAITGDMGGGRTRSGGAATAQLVVTGGPQAAVGFAPDVISPGETSTLTVTLTNPSTTQAIDTIAFDALLGASLQGFVFGAPPASGFCGAGAQLLIVPDTTNGTRMIMQGGSLAAGASCSFTLDVTAGLGAPALPYALEITPSAQRAGQPVTGKTASGVIQVRPSARLTRSFSPSTLAPGGATTVTYTLELGEAAAGLTDLAFTDDLSALVPGASVSGTPLQDVCGAGSSLTGAPALTFTGGALMPQTSCTFSAQVTIPQDAAPGVYTSPTSAVSGTFGGATVQSAAADSALSVVGLEAELDVVGDPTLPGEQVTLAFTLRNPDATRAATGVSFTMNLNSALSGLSASSAPQSDVCGAGSSLSGTSTLVFAGGSLAAGASCSFSVVADVPAGAALGDYTVRSGAVSYTVDGQARALDGFGDRLVLSEPLLITLDVVGDPIEPGGAVTLDVVLENANTSQPMTDVAFTLDLDAALPGLVATGTPLQDACGAGSSLSGTSTLTFTGGTLAAGASCKLSITLQLPSAGAGARQITSSAPTAMIGGQAVAGLAGQATLNIFSARLRRAFAPGIAGQSTTLTYTIEHLGGPALTSLSFVDALGDALPGLSASAVTPQAPCGARSSLQLGEVVRLRDGALEVGASCVFTVTVDIPAAVTIPSVTTISGPLREGGAQVGVAVSATLNILATLPTAALVASPETITAGEASTITLTLDHSAGALALTALGATVALPDGLSVAESPAPSTTCAGGAITIEAGALTLTGATLDGGATCTVTASVVGEAEGAYTITARGSAQAGTTAEVTTTLTVNAAATEDMGMTGDMGMTEDMGTSGDMGASQDMGTTPAPDTLVGDGCGCAASPAQNTGLGALWLLAGLVALVRRRTRDARR